jgi:hypothetical protein
MNGDSLSSLVAAYREEHRGTALDSAAVRERVTSRRRRKDVQERKRFRILVPIAAVLAASGAFAATNGGEAALRHLLQWLHPTPQIVPQSSGMSPPLLVQPPGPAGATREGTGSSAPSPLPAEANEAPSAARVLHDKGTARRTPGSKLVTQHSSRAAEPAPEPDLVLYHEAHRLHFHGSDAAHALAAWDAYLATFPDGTFVPEARMNRAICLIRVGRRPEARAVLAAIAEGRFGPFDRGRAQDLLDDLDARLR